MPEKLKVELDARPADPAPGPGQQLCRSRPTSSTARRRRASRSRPTCASPIDDQPFADFGKYSFGSENERKKFEPPFITLTAPDTDQAGKSRLEWGGDQVKDTTLPLRAQIQARVFEPGDGRATRADKTVPLRTRDVYLGIRPTFDGRYASEGAVTRVRHRGGRRRRQADRPPGGRVPHRAHRL